MKFEELSQEEKEKLARTYLAATVAFYNPNDQLVDSILNGSPLLPTSKARLDNGVDYD